MEAIEAIHSRRSVRAYTDAPLDRHLIESVIRDAGQAPTPFGSHVPWTFNVIQGADRIATLGALAMELARARYGGEPDWRWLDRPGFQIFWGAPVLIVISGETGDCCRAGQNLALSAHARGLATCWVGSALPWLWTEEARSELQIPAALTPAVAICLGYPKEIPPRPPRGEPAIIWVA